MAFESKTHKQNLLINIKTSCKTYLSYDFESVTVLKACEKKVKASKNITLQIQIVQ